MSLKVRKKKDRLRSILDGRKNLFSQEKFYRDIKNFVDSFFRLTNNLENEDVIIRTIINYTDYHKLPE